VMQSLVNYSWPGNIRELQNVIERAVVLSTGNDLTLSGEFDNLKTTKAPSVESAVEAPAPAAASRATNAGIGSLDEAEKRHIEAALSRANWMIEGERGAAKILEMNPSTLRSRMQKLGIRRCAKPPA
jgi:formate hydrogenlyase transcriptional activator